jgi:hypothetical protein
VWTGDQWSFSSGLTQCVQWVPELILWLFSQNAQLGWVELNLAEFPHWFPNLWSECYYGVKGQMEAIRTALPGKIAHQK